MEQTVQTIGSDGAVTRQPRVGEPVIYVDPVGGMRHAIVTQPWGLTCINLVFVSGDEDRKDSFGRQIERQSSCMHASVVPVHGNYWRFPDEPGKPTENDVTV
jgi:hypothetical protein